MERWTFLVIAGPDGEAAQIRVCCAPARPGGLAGGPDRAGRHRPAASTTAAHDYEAPEWKAVQLLDEGMGGGGAARLDQVKGRLRSQAAA